MQQRKYSLSIIGSPYYFAPGNDFIPSKNRLARNMEILQVFSLQDLQDLASLARRKLARFRYFLQDDFYWVTLVTSRVASLLHQLICTYVAGQLHQITMHVHCLHWLISTALLCQNAFCRPCKCTGKSTAGEMVPKDSSNLAELPVRKIYRVSRILQEYPCKVFTFLQGKNHLFCIMLNLLRNVQESYKHLQYSCTFLARSYIMQDKWFFPCKSIKVLKGYLCKILDTLIRFFLLHGRRPDISLTVSAGLKYLSIMGICRSTC